MTTVELEALARDFVELGIRLNEEVRKRRDDSPAWRNAWFGSGGAAAIAKRAERAILAAMREGAA